LTTKGGAGITEQLLFDKVCLYELHYPPHVCSNLTANENESTAVQHVVNEFSRNVQLMIHYAVPKRGIRGFTSLPKGPPEGWSAAEPRGWTPREDSEGETYNPVPERRERRDDIIIWQSNTQLSEREREKKREKEREKERERERERGGGGGRKELFFASRDVIQNISLFEQ
jgi:hypothetical protein